MRFFKIVAKAAVAFYDELFFYFLYGLIHTVAWVLIIPGPFALAGMYTIGQKAVRGLGVKWRILWDGIKEFGLRSLLLAVITLLGYGVVVTNVMFYGNPDISPFPPSVAAWTTPLFILLGLLWSGVVFYAQAFLVELEEPKLKHIYRNALFLTILHPIQTLLFLVVSVLVVAISIALPVLVLVAPGFLAALSITAVRTLVAGLTEKAEALAEKEAAEAAEEQADSEEEADQEAGQAEDAETSDEGGAG
jgi:uncharacterized membrane protein YesL